MTDLVKLLVVNKRLVDYFFKHPLLDYLSEKEKLICKKEGLVLSEKTKTYKGIHFFFNERLKTNDIIVELNILIKPHYYFNNNKHNANDFKASDSIKVFQEFIDTFNIKEHLYPLIKVVNIEYGLNFILSGYGKELISYLSRWGRHEFVNDDGLKYSKKAFSTNRKGRRNNYLFNKFYSKGVQFPQYTDIKTNRFEVKSKESKRIFKTIGVLHINDLLIPSIYHKMKIDLLNQVDKLLIFDAKTKTDNLTVREINRLNKYLNSSSWFITLQQSRNAFTDRKKNYIKLLNKTNYNIHTALKKTIENKLKILVDIENENCANSTPKTKSENCANSTISIVGIRTINTLEKPRIKSTQKKVGKGGTNTVRISEKKERFCLVTGLDISIQKGSSILLSHTGLRHYLKTDKKVFDEVAYLYLSKKWKYSDIEIQIKELGHNIRNKHNNNSLKQIRLYNPSQIRLF